MRWYSEVLLTALIEFQGSKPCRWHMQLICTEHSLCVSTELGKMHTCFNCWLSAIWWKWNAQIQIMQWISPFLSLVKDIHGEPLQLPQAKCFIFLFVEESTILLLNGCDRKEMRKSRLSQLVLRKQKCEMQIIRWSITTFYCRSKASFICGLIFYFCDDSQSRNWPSILFFFPHICLKIEFWRILNLAKTSHF